MNRKIRLIDVLLILYVITIFLYTDDSSTLYISNVMFAVFGIAAFLWIACAQKGKSVIAPDLFIVVPLLLFSAFTVPLALNASLAVEKFFTLIILFVLTVLIYNCFTNNGDPNIILFALMMAGFLVSINIIFNYGYKEMLQLLMSGIRVGSEELQLNYLGRYTYMCAIISFYFAYYKKRRIMYLGALIGAFVCVSSQSRQALLTLIVTVVLLYLIKDFSKKRLIRFAVKIAIVFFAALVIVNLPVLSALRERMFSGLSSVATTTVSSESDQKRVYMIQFGLKVFYQHPIFGIGFGNVREVVSGILSEYKYLHNNYVELLACGGMLGFVLYYAIYIKIFRNIKYILKHTSAYHDEIVMVAVLLIGQLILDMFVVSYYSKVQYIIFAYAFIISGKCMEELRKNRKEIK